MPKVSVIVPVYNVEKYIDKCLNTLINQTLNDIQIIIVNDGSTDSSYKIIEKYVDQNKNKIIYIEKENGGLSDARNVGIQHATGEYIGCTDSDDYVELSMYEKMYDAACQNNADLVECDFYWEYKHKLRTDIGKVYNVKDILVQARAMAWNKIIKRELINKYNIEYPIGLRYEDSEFFYKLVPYIHVIGFVKEPLYHYIQRNDSICHIQNEKTRDMFDVLDNVVSYYKKKGFYEEYKEQLEYVCIRYLLGSSFLRITAIYDKETREKILEENWRYLNTRFHDWKRNYILRTSKSPKDIYFRTTNNFTYKIYSDFFNLINTNKFKKFYDGQKENMQIVVYSEHLLCESNGGAEVFALRLAETLRYKLSYDVKLLTFYAINTKNMSISDVFEKYNIKEIMVKKIPTITISSFLRFLIRIYNERIIRFYLKSNEIFINCSANRLIGCSKTKNIHVIHFPLKPYKSIAPIPFISDLLDNRYRSSYSFFLPNSSFSQYYLKKYWNIDGWLVYPPIITQNKSVDLSLKKKNIIIVGRIVPDKKIKEMISAYINSKLRDIRYRLVIIGNKDAKHLNYYNELEDLAKKHDGILVKTDVSDALLKQLYSEATIFWHGKGYNVEETVPIEMEHFGMTTVEAMSYGCVPIVINKAGQTEIVENGISGYLWNTLDELISFTFDVITNDDLLEKMRYNTLVRSKYFSMTKFTSEFSEVIKSLV
jgi:glycosyltransferase involved in cell wall biosynthesis